MRSGGERCGVATTTFELWVAASLEGVVRRIILHFQTII